MSHALVEATTDFVSLVEKPKAPADELDAAMQEHDAVMAKVLGVGKRPARPLPGARRADIEFSKAGLNYSSSFGLITDASVGEADHRRLMKWVFGCTLPGRYKRGTDDKIKRVLDHPDGRELLRTLRGVWLPKGDDHKAPHGIVLVVARQSFPPKGAWTLQVQVARKGSGGGAYKPKR